MCILKLAQEKITQGEYEGNGEDRNGPFGKIPNTKQTWRKQKPSWMMNVFQQESKQFKRKGLTTNVN